MTIMTDVAMWRVVQGHGVSESIVTFSLTGDGRRLAEHSKFGVAAAEFGGIWECDIAELSIPLNEQIVFEMSKREKCIPYSLLKISIKTKTPVFFSERLTSPHGGCF